MQPARGSREGGKAALSSEMRAGESRGVLEAQIRGSTSPASGEGGQMRSPCPSVASRARGKGRESKGLPKARTTAAAWQVDVGPSCPASVGACSRLGRDKSLWRARRAGGLRASQSPPRCRRASLHLPALFLGQAPRTPLGEVSHAEGGGQKKRDKTPGGGGANLKADQSRLLRDLRVDTKSRWARLLQENPNPRKNKGSKKGTSKGCFGLKLDRIGSTSGLGC